MSEFPPMCDLCGKVITGSYVQTLRASPKINEIRCSPCDVKRRRAKFKETGRLTTWLVTEARLNQTSRPPTLEEGDAEILHYVGSLKELIGQFDRSIWLPELQQLARKCETKGLSFQKDGFSFLCYTIAGRAMLTFSDKDSSITVITDETSREPVMGLQGIDATGPQAIYLLLTAMKYWKDGVRPHSDADVRMAGMPG